TLEIKDLHVSVDDKEILKGIDLLVRSGEAHAIMGPNGSGKSTLSLAIMGHPRYKVTKGEVLLDGTDVLKLPVDERARKGLFLAFQYPSAIPGVSVANFLRTDIDALKTIATGIESLRGPDIGILLITHYERILRYVQPDFVHVLVDGRIVRTGGRELAAELERKGYDFVREELYQQPAESAGAAS